MNKQLLLIVAGALTIASSGYVYAAQLYTTDNLIAREASEGPRGADRVHTGTHKNSVDTLTIARRGADDVVPHPRGEGVNHPNSVDVEVLARRGADDPVGSERPGEVHGQKRGGRNMIDTDSFIIAREATEAPRGADNNNHRQRGRA